MGEKRQILHTEFKTFHVFSPPSRRWSRTLHSFSEGPLQWLPFKKMTVWERAGKSNFTVEKTDRYYLRQVIKVYRYSNKSFDIIVHRAAKSQTWLSDWTHTHTHTHTHTQTPLIGHTGNFSLILCSLLKTH